MDETHRAKIAKAQRERWKKVKEDKEAVASISDRSSQFMRSYWAGKTKEERLQRANKAAATRRANQIAKAQRGK